MLGIDAAEVSSHRAPWSKGRLIGQKRPLKPKEVWAIRVQLQLEERRQSKTQPARTWAHHEHKQQRSRKLRPVPDLDQSVPPADFAIFCGW